MPSKLNKDRYTTILSRLPVCESCYDILELLFDHAKACGLSSLRYYRYLGSQSRMVSVDCIGHETRIQAKLRAGRISQDPEVSSPSFYAIQKNKPVIMCLNSSQKDSFIIEDSPNKQLAYCTIRNDDCAGVLDEIRPAAKRWVDIPLTFSNRKIGKLSCDITEIIDHNAEHLHNNIAAFCELANYAVPYLESFASYDISWPLQQAMSEIVSKKNYASLYHYCTTELIKLNPLIYDYLNIYIVSEDSLGSPLLILRGTSCSKLLSQVNILRFTSEECGAVPWVWKTQKSLHLLFTQDKNDFNRQLEDYPGLTWRTDHRFDQLTSLLVIPIHASKELIGVLSCGRHTPSVEPHEQLLLQNIADSCLGPKMVGLRNEEFAVSVRKNLKHLHLELIQDAAESTDITDNIRKSIEAFFPTEGNRIPSSNILIQLCLIDRSRTNVKTFLVGGSLQTEVTNRNIYPLGGTLTEYVFSEYIKGNTQTVFINDLDNAVAKGRYLRTEPSARCALASIITYDKEVYGALIVLSDTYNILPTQYGRIIELIACQVGQIIARREIIEYSSFITNLRHDCNTPLVKIASILDNTTGHSLSSDVNLVLQRHLDFISDAIFVHCRRGPMPPEVFLANVRRTNIREEIRNAAIQALYEATNLAEIELDTRLTLFVNPDLELPVASSFLMIAVFNILKNSWQADPTGRTSVSYKLDSLFISIFIENTCTEIQKDRIISSIGNEVPQALHPLWFERTNEVKASGMRLVQRILNWYRIFQEPRQTIASGTFEYAFFKENKVRFTLTFPLPYMPPMEIASA